MSSVDDPGLLRTVSGGYVLAVPEEQHDLVVFRGLVKQARRARDDGQAEAARALFAQAVALWRGAVVEGSGRCSRTRPSSPWRWNTPRPSWSTRSPRKPAERARWCRCCGGSRRPTRSTRSSTPG
ncbi:BTAD domain-containing putative transcriptional regulator [Amycolatopsis australiensis]|uniref:AfsR/SARP family transcriptional regulator n=1 Tax=Amycolatopsis australiensis TaxID=546364 RepID=UPI000A000EB1